MTNGHSFATGGSSTGEWWGEPHRLGDGLDVNGVESCTTYNTLKVARALFSWTLDPDAMDLYERAKFSGMFGTMHPTVVGRIIYLLPLRGPDGLAGGSKARSYWGWSDPLDSMWCCVGSGLESHSKHGELLFMQQAAAAAAVPTLLVTLFDDADVAWAVPGAGGAVVDASQRVAWDPAGVTVTVTVSGAGAARFALALRVPGWAEAPSATLDGASLTPAAGWFNTSARMWPAGGGVLVARLPFSPRLEHLDDDRSQFAAHHAIVAGPFALGALTRVDDVIIGANETGSAPAWVRPLSAAERAAAVSFAAPGMAPGAFLRHDNDTAALAALVALPGGGGGPLTWTLQPAGFLAAGEDLVHGPLTLAEGQAMCANLTACVGLTFDSADARPAGAVDMYLKSVASFTAAAGWTAWTNSRASDALGGDDDGGDSTWIVDAPLATGGARRRRLPALAQPAGRIPRLPRRAARCGLRHRARAARRRLQRDGKLSRTLAGADGRARDRLVRVARRCGALRLIFWRRGARRAACAAEAAARCHVQCKHLRARRGQLATRADRLRSADAGRRGRCARQPRPSPCARGRHCERMVRCLPPRARGGAVRRRRAPRDGRAVRRMGSTWEQFHPPLSLLSPSAPSASRPAPRGENGTF